MGKTFRRGSGFKPKGKDFNRFKKSNKFKHWDEKPVHTKPIVEPEKEKVEE
jgi:hypothetical protein